MDRAGTKYSAYGATLKIYPGALHGMCSTLEDQVNAELLAFLGRSNQASA
jgi:hypothetical protein